MRTTLKATKIISKFLIFFFFSAFIWEVFVAMFNLGIPPYWDAALRIIVVCLGLYLLFTPRIFNFFRTKVLKIRPMNPISNKVAIIRILTILIVAIILFTFGYQRLADSLDDVQITRDILEQYNKENLFIRQVVTSDEQSWLGHGLLIEFGVRKVDLLPVTISLEITNPWYTRDYWWDKPGQDNKSSLAIPFDGKITYIASGRLSVDMVAGNVTANFTMASPKASLKFFDVPIATQLSLYMYFTSNEPMNFKTADYNGLKFVWDGKNIVPETR